MFCYKCGNIVPDDAEFCSKCGAPFNTGNAPGQAAATPKKKKKALPIILGMLAVIAVVIVIVVSTSGSKDDIEPVITSTGVKLSKICKNDDEGFSFLYPGGWVAVSKDELAKRGGTDNGLPLAFLENEIDGMPEESTYISVMKANLSQEDIDHIYINDKEFAQTFSDYLEVKDTSLVSIDGVRARKITYYDPSSSMGTESYFYAVGTTLYRIDFNWYGESCGNNQKFFDAVIDNYTITAENAVRTEGGAPIAGGGSKDSAFEPDAVLKKHLTIYEAYLEFDYPECWSMLNRNVTTYVEMIDDNNTPEHTASLRVSYLAADIFGVFTDSNASIKNSVNEFREFITVKDETIGDFPARMLKSRIESYTGGDLVTEYYYTTGDEIYVIAFTCTEAFADSYEKVFDAIIDSAVITPADEPAYNEPSGSEGQSEIESEGNSIEASFVQDCSGMADKPSSDPMITLYKGKTMGEGGSCQFYSKNNGGTSMYEGTWEYGMGPKNYIVYVCTMKSEYDLLGPHIAEPLDKEYRFTLTISGNEPNAAKFTLPDGSDTDIYDYTDDGDSFAVYY